MRDDGFAVLDLDPESIQIFKTFATEGLKFFRLDQNTKDTYKSDTRTYMTHESKEYFKFFLPETPKLPGEDETSSFTQTFQKSSKLFFEIATTCYTLLMSTVKVLETTSVENILSIAGEKSSLSMIHYNPFPTETMPSEPHEDTGILTFGFVGPHSGLQILQRSSSVYLPVESIYPQSSVILWPGRKMSLFLGSNILAETTHQVVLGPNTERYAVIFLFDVSG